MWPEEVWKEMDEWDMARRVRITGSPLFLFDTH
jgi:hypothetical protein